MPENSLMTASAQVDVASFEVRMPTKNAYKLSLIPSKSANRVIVIVDKTIINKNNKSN